MQKVLSIILGIVAISLAGFGLWKDTNIQSQISLLESPSFGSVNPATPAVFETYLANAEGTTDTSLTLASGSLRDGSSLNGYVCLTIDSNTSSLEYECGTASGATVSNLLRGVDATTGTTSISSLIFSHRRGADVKITDYPALTIATNQLNGIQTIPALLQYANTLLIGPGSASTTLATKYYVDNTASAGAANASVSVKGIVQIPTALQAASSTVFGSTGATLALPASIATDTPNTSTRGSIIPMTAIGGFLAQAWLDFTQAFTFTGGVTINTNPLTVNSSAVFNGPASFPGGLTGADWQLVVATTTKATTLLLQATTTTAYLRYRIYIDTYGFTPTAGGGQSSIRFNNDSNTGLCSGSSCYTSQTCKNFVCSNLTGQVGYASIGDGTDATASPQMIIIDLYNPTTTKKYGTWTGFTQPTSTPSIPMPIINNQGAFTWNSTTTQITNFEFGDLQGNGASMYASSTMTVYGSNSGN